MSGVSIILIGAFLYVAWIVAMAIGATAIVLVMLACFMMDVGGRWIERRAVHVGPWDKIDNSTLLLWGTIADLNDTHVPFFRVRLPFSRDWRQHTIDYGHNFCWCWHERWIVWTGERGWFEWFEPVEHA